MEAAGTQRKRLTTTVLLTVYVVLALWLRWQLGNNLPQHWSPDWSDDFVYVRSADHLLQGDWLGAYDFRLLRQPCGLPLYLAFSSQTGLTESTLRFFLHAGACLLVLLGLVRLKVPRVPSVLAFTLILFNPTGLGRLSSRLAPENLVAVLGLLLVGLLLLAIQASSRLRFWAAAVPAVLVVAFASITTRDADVLAPLLVLGTTAHALIAGGPKERTKALLTRTLPCLLLAFVTSFGMRSWVEGRNEHHYGTGVVHELEDPDFLNALGSIRRVARAAPTAFEALSASQRHALYEVSPSMAELKDVLEGDLYSGPASREDRSGRPAALFRLALREAAATVGKHRDPVTAKNFYRQLADEVNSACDEGKLGAVSDQYHHDLPPVDLAGIGKALHLLWYRIHELWHFDYEDVEPADALAGIEADSAEIAIYERILHDRPGRMAASPYKDAAARATVRHWYQVVVPALFFAAIVAFITQFALRRERGIDRAFVIETVIFASAAITAFSVCVNEVFWRPDRGRGLLTAYPMLFIWAAVSLAAYARVGRKGALPARGSHVLAGLVILLILLIGSAWSISTSAANTESPLFDTSAPGLQDYYVFGRGAELSATDEGVRIDFPDLEQKAEFRLRSMPRGADAVLVLEADIAEDMLDASFEIGWTGNRRDVLDLQKRRLFPKRAGANTWRLPVSAGRFKTISLWTEESPGLSMTVRALRLENAEKPHETGTFPVPKVAADLAADGTLTLRVMRGEQESRYDFYLSHALDQTPRQFPERTGGMYLNDAVSVRTPEGEPLRIHVVTNASGDGVAEYSAKFLLQDSASLHAQGVGTRHFTAPVQVKRSGQ